VVVPQFKDLWPFLASQQAPARTAGCRAVVISSLELEQPKRATASLQLSEYLLVCSVAEGNVSKHCRPVLFPRDHQIAVER
jgi:hypothetical protein